jgi:two-component sensor histidine kinase/CheY-like chemotaxis protein
VTDTTASEPIRLLYIDDDAALGRLVERNLTRQGLHVTHALSGEDGLRFLRERTFDAVALDHFMPGRDGSEILTDIMALPDPPPVVYVTGADEGRIAVAALKSGASDYVIKDVGGVFLDLLRSAIEQALAGARLRREKALAERELLAAKETAEMLLREVNHRVANSLQLVASLVVMQQRSMVSDPAAREALSETHGRIAAIAQIHRRLYTSDDVRFVELNTYLQGLVEELEAAMRAAGREHAIALDAQPLRVATDKAVSIGVIVTELVTNAFKYAYPPAKAGEIRVRLTLAHGRGVLAVEDDGVGWNPDEPSQGTGLGTKIMRAMAANLQTHLDIRRQAHGTHVALTFPL